VYRARDLKLKREVAIKILPEAFPHDADRVRRFQREAEVLASLNHPPLFTESGMQTEWSQKMVRLASRDRAIPRTVVETFEIVKPEAMPVRSVD